MTDARERFWNGIITCTTFTIDGIPNVEVSTIPGTGVSYTPQSHRIASYYSRGSVVEVNIGKSDQAYAILHGELRLEVSNLPPHLIVTWLHWDDEEPVYQSDYTLDDDEVMPSDEVDIIPCTMLSGHACLPGALPDRSDDSSDGADMGGIHWKRTHVYVSSTSTAMPILQATQEHPYERKPSQEAISLARRRYIRESREALPTELSPRSKRRRSSDEDAFRLTQHVAFPSIRSSIPKHKAYQATYTQLPSPPLTSIKP